MRLLEIHLAQHFNALKNSAHPFDLNEEIFAPLQGIILAFSLWFGAKKGLFGGIDDLAKLGIFSTTGGTHLKKAVERLFLLKLEAELFYHEARHLFYSSKKPQPNGLSMNPGHIQNLSEIYRVLMPFYECVKQFKEKGEKGSLKNHFYQDEKETLAFVRKKLDE